MVTLKVLTKLYRSGVISLSTYIMIRKKKKIEEKLSRRLISFKRFDLTKYSDDQCKVLFRFTKDEILRLTACFQFPPIIRLPTREKFKGLEGFCLLLRRLSYPNRLVDLKKMFYRGISTLSKMFAWILNFLYEKAASVLSTLKANWMDNQTFEMFAQACKNAGSYYGKIVGFIDGTGRQICRPSFQQKLQYSGYKKTHLIKYQSVVFPNGVIGRLDGPFNGHRHDSAILKLSKIKAEMEQEFNERHFNYSLYADPGYSNQKYIKVGFKNYKKLSEQQKQFNKDMSALRVSVEYGFGQISQQFAFLDFKKNQKLYRQELRQQYFVAAMLANCQTCLRGNQISEYFNLMPPDVETYLQIL